MTRPPGFTDSMMSPIICDDMASVSRSVPSQSQMMHSGCSMQMMIRMNKQSHRLQIRLFVQPLARLTSTRGATRPVGDPQF